jgi:hypothetical protein
LRNKVSQPDYFSQAKWEPPPKPPRKPLGLLPFIVGAVLLLLGGAAFAFPKLIEWNEQRLAKLEASLEFHTPAAKVVTGEPLKWRTLATFAQAGTREDPRPEIVFADFNRDQRHDIFMLDFKGKSKVLQPDGSSQTIKGQWDVVTRFYAWDYERDGIAELIPHSVVNAIVPVTPTSFAAVRLCGG